MTITDDEARKLAEEAIHWYLAMKAQLYHYRNSEDSIPKWKDKGQVVAAEDFDMLAIKVIELIEAKRCKERPIWRSRTSGWSGCRRSHVRTR